LLCGDIGTGRIKQDASDQFSSRGVPGCRSGEETESRSCPASPILQLRSMDGSRKPLRWRCLPLAHQARRSDASSRDATFLHILRTHTHKVHGSMSATSPAKNPSAMVTTTEFLRPKCRRGVHSKSTGSARSGLVGVHAMVADWGGVTNMSYPGSLRFMWFGRIRASSRSVHGGLVLWPCRCVLPFKMHFHVCDMINPES